MFTHDMVARHTHDAGVSRTAGPVIVMVRSTTRGDLGLVPRVIPVLVGGHRACGDVLMARGHDGSTARAEHSEESGLEQ